MDRKFAAKEGKGRVLVGKAGSKQEMIFFLRWENNSMFESR